MMQGSENFGLLQKIIKDILMWYFLLFKTTQIFGVGGANCSRE